MEKREPTEVCRLVCQERWKTKHLQSAAGQFGESYVADALLCAFLEGEPKEGSYSDQKIAGALLLQLGPRPSSSLIDIVSAALPRWNVSVPEFVYYLDDLFGRAMLLEAIERMEATRSLAGHEKRSAETMRWWLRGRTERKAAQPGATDNPDDAQRN